MHAMLWLFQNKVWFTQWQWTIEIMHQLLSISLISPYFKQPYVNIGSTRTEFNNLSVKIHPLA
jgi:hypothetical protein